VGSLSQFEENVGPLLWGHLSAGKGVRGIGCFEGVKNADYFLHSFILLRFPLVFPFWFRYPPMPAPRFTPPGLSPRACRMRSSHTWAAARSLPRIAWL
jgi:hypothetical protein